LPTKRTSTPNFLRALGDTAGRPWTAGSGTLVDIEGAPILKLVIRDSPIKTHEPIISQALFAHT
jgi:hypothetical protein